MTRMARRLFCCMDSIFGSFAVDQGYVPRESLGTTTLSIRSGDHRAMSTAAVVAAVVLALAVGSALLPIARRALIANNVWDVPGEGSSDALSVCGGVGVGLGGVGAV